MTKKGTAKRVLLMEDESALSRIIGIKLGNAGFEVVTAMDGEAGLKLAGESDFDLVILDLMMPVVDGFSVLKSLRESGNRTPVLVTSNLSQPADEARARELGAQEFMIKSDVSLSEIVECVRRLTNGKTR
ncbi:MAG: response regulator [bacterium]